MYACVCVCVCVHVCVSAKLYLFSLTLSQTETDGQQATPDRQMRRNRQTQTDLLVYLQKEREGPNDSARVARVVEILLVGVGCRRVDDDPPTDEELKRSFNV